MPSCSVLHQLVLKSSNNTHTPALSHPASAHPGGRLRPQKRQRASPRLCGLARSSLFSPLFSLPPSFVSACKRLARFLGWAFPFTVFWKKGGLLGFILLVLGTTPHVRLFPHFFFFSCDAAKTFLTSQV